MNLRIEIVRLITYEALMDKIIIDFIDPVSFSFLL